MVLRLYKKALIKRQRERERVGVHAFASLWWLCSTPSLILEADCINNTIYSSQLSVKLYVYIFNGLSNHRWERE